MYETLPACRSDFYLKKHGIIPSVPRAVFEWPTGVCKHPITTMHSSGEHYEVVCVTCDELIDED